MNISITKLKLFKACRRAYQLKYIEGLEPVEKADSLQTGIDYHALLEGLYKTGSLETNELNKETAMAMAYMKFIYPKFKVQIAEEWLNYELPSGDTLIGRIDGLAEDGRLVEHKTTSQEITEEYEYNLLWDEQILAYMLMSGSREIYYTVCRKPTIRQKKGESDEDFFSRMVSWYEEDTDSKIRLLKLPRTDEEVEAFKRGLERMASEMKTKNFYRNTTYCHCWGRRCEYASVCLHYDPSQEYIEFTRKEEE